MQSIQTVIGKTHFFSPKQIKAGMYYIPTHRKNGEVMGKVFSGTEAQAQERADQLKAQYA